jgi:hypothetical protein
LTVIVVRNLSSAVTEAPPFSDPIDPPCQICDLFEEIS